MEYLPSASQGKYVEERLLFGFTALETLVNGIHKLDATDRNIPRSSFERLSRDLKAVVDNHCVSAGLTPSAAASIASKFAELNRPPIGAQVEALITAGLKELSA